MVTIFYSKQVSLTALEEKDLEKLRDWRNLPHMRKSAREYRLLNMIIQKNWFKSIHENDPPKEIMFGIISKNSLIGVTGLTYIDWKNRHAEISIYMAKPGWQKTKLAKEVLELVMKYGFNELNLHRLWAEIFLTTSENVLLFKTLNFKLEGTLRQKLWRDGKWWNSVVYSKLAMEF